ncbi:hypothetical protein [Elizabethkingia anophelis]|uniref:hypothetical protein n=1 Tax=Elizabethkingia anophelis TaxID=1117645 RepID=UPI00099AEE5E|nr:hypothetical protein [Elizabethkingia anophelis]AQX90691.1 hypothetical protein AYC67_17475 [Elizabethkingia anophelis]EHM7981850.1 hypothetical protein [Elizabethkingia anophelis]EHZ9535302.1 hypothetical protein [Elizabethkingia anophelis]EKU3673212.1 hypothetical protein [Elizabethkingia anophelis]EKU4210189.1 hypothetical protein [Elizabethkingia anophelis]
MLNNFFHINLPYGIARNTNGEWIAFNREYMPLGFNDYNFKGEVEEDYSDKPIYTKYKGITEKFLNEIAFDQERGIIRDDQNSIKRVFLYDGSVNPSLTKSEIHWDSYFEKIKKLSKLQIEML